MNRRERRKMVRATKEGDVNKALVLKNASYISEILHKRFTFKLKENNIDYIVDNNEVKTKDVKRTDAIYEEELTKLKDELVKFKGDYKKIKLYE